MKYYMLDEDCKVRCFESAKEYIAYANSEGAETMQIRRTVKKDEIDGHFISTVILLLDHSLNFANDPNLPPLIFETMIFPDCEYCERCSTYEQALVMHQEAIDFVRNKSSVKEEV